MEKELGDTARAPSGQVSESSLQRTAPREGMPASWYQAGLFTYPEGQCFFDPPNPPPRTRARIQFECGIISIGLGSGARAGDVADLLSTVQGRILRDHSGGEFSSLVIRVPAGTERTAVLTILGDRRVRYASLNWVMGTQG